MYNTIGGSSGSHGSVGIGLRYDNDHTIKYNNIGGFTSNIVIHGYKENLEFTGINFLERWTLHLARETSLLLMENQILRGTDSGDSFDGGILSIST